jgi:hypothetical protein
VPTAITVTEPRLPPPGTSSSVSAPRRAQVGIRRRGAPVDGLNTIDARHTNAAEARKWIIDPYQTITISGWQTSRTVARRFEFTTEEQSYAQALGQPSDLGVITAVYFRERVRPVVVDGTTVQVSMKSPWATFPAALTTQAGVMAAPSQLQATGEDRTLHPIGTAHSSSTRA